MTEEKGTVGVEELKDLVKFSCRLTNACAGALKDGRVTIADAALLFSPLQALPAALSGLKEVPAEVKDLDPLEAAQLAQLVKEELDLENDQVEAVAEEVISLTLQLAAVLLITLQKKPE